MGAGVTFVPNKHMNPTHPLRRAAGLAAAVLCVLIPLLAAATTRYVDCNSSLPRAPYLAWGTAARQIQDAIDVASPGDLILVAKGEYASGGRVVHGTLNNRVALTKRVRVQSVSGPALTRIRGLGAGELSGRCAYLSDGAILQGFTLFDGQGIPFTTDQFDQDGGGAWCESVNAFLLDCVLRNNEAYDSGGAVVSGTLIACTLATNFAYMYGGGAYESQLNDCMLLGNWAEYGGGAYNSVLSGCVLATNGVSGRGSEGGGAYRSTLIRCNLLGNTAMSQYGGGGGGSDCTLSDCTLVGNSAPTSGGGGASGCHLQRCVLSGNLAYAGAGADGGDLSNCLLAGNTAAVWGGGACQSTLTNCTVVRNQTQEEMGGGLFFATAKNCIIYDNTAAGAALQPNVWGGTVEYTCTVPLPASGVGNVAGPPLFVDAAAGNYRLQDTSPCINAGNNAAVSGRQDLDGRERIVAGVVDMGAYELVSQRWNRFIVWLADYHLATDGSDDYVDDDGDRMDNWNEWMAGTVPTNAASVLKLFCPTRTPSGLRVSWSSVPGRRYDLERASGLDANASFRLLRTNITSVSGTTTVVDSELFDAPTFYRIGIAE